MTPTLSQICILLDRAAELRDQGQAIQRELAEILAQISALRARHTRESQRPSHDLSGETRHDWRRGPGDPDTPDTHM
jgi:uncharacterized protein HemX